MRTARPDDMQAGISRREPVERYGSGELDRAIVAAKALGYLDGQHDEHVRAWVTHRDHEPRHVASLT
jgi:hypothetical protein